MEISDLKVGNYVVKYNSNLDLKVIEIGYIWQSDSVFARFYNNVTGHKSQRLINISNYKKV